MANFIGYAALEDLARAMLVEKPVFASPITRPGKPGQYGLRVDRYEIVVSQPDVWGDVHFCIIPIGRLQTLPNNDDLDGRKSEILQRQDQAWHIVRDWLIGVMGFTLREAGIATPDDYQFLDGWFNVLKWNAETKAFEVDPDEAMKTADQLVIAG